MYDLPLLMIDVPSAPPSSKCAWKGKRSEKNSSIYSPDKYPFKPIPATVTAKSSIYGTATPSYLTAHPCTLVELFGVKGHDPYVP